MFALFSALRAATVVSTMLLASACSLKSVHGPLHHSSQGKDTEQVNAHAPQNAPVPSTYRLADDGSEWKRAPQMHAYYDATVTAFAHGTDIDVNAYEAKSFAIFREFARAHGVSEQAMLDHLKLIPRQVVGIVKENPAVLESYDSFWTALVGPD